MKQLLLLATVLLSIGTASAQTDSTRQEKKQDTIRIGGIVIIKGKDKDSKSKTIIIEDSTKIVRKKAKSDVSTNWWIVDLGFANYTDKTNYANALASGFVGPGVGEDQLDLRTGKSVNVNIWFFMQRLNLVKHYVNLKYGLGLELNNYRYTEPVLFNTSPTQVVMDTRHYNKNKLAADYLTVPLMLNFNFNPNRRKSFSLSAGVSGGYLYSARQKTITGEDGKQKERDDFDLRKFKLAYIGEIGLGPVKLYGSLATQSMFEKGLDQTPFNVGFRLSNW